MLDRYEPHQFEAKWRQKWLEADLFRTREEEGRQKFYGLDFFPYPSGAGLSVGHCRNYVPTDVLCRMKYMQGYNVLHPMGFDAFGLPAENEAIKRKSHPRPMIDQYADNYRRQMDLVGISYDWSRTFKSCEPSYYRWTQWIFELLYKRGLAYKKDAEVNWCPKDKTALANEEVVAGLCERCGTPVEKKAIPQWYFKITDYAQRLIDDLDDLDWPDGIKHQQRNWIGRSEGVQFRLAVELDALTSTASGATSPPAEDFSAPEGEDVVAGEVLADLEAEVRAEGYLLDNGTSNRIKAIQTRLERQVQDFENPLNLETFENAKTKIQASLLKGAKEAADASGWSVDEFEIQLGILSFEVFTTRIDTIFGMSFCVLAPEHPLVDRILGQLKSSQDVDRQKTATAIEGYRDQVRTESEANRLAEGRVKTGVPSGASAIHPLTGARVPIWIADYVLMGYGTGAIMAVPAGDQRDFEFAVKFGIPVVPIQAPPLEWLEQNAIDKSNSTDKIGRAHV